MESVRVLLTGDYGHDDFRLVVADSSFAKLLVPLAEVDDWKDDTFDLVVVAESRRGQIDQADVEKIRRLFPLVPIVNLLGSWSEGVERSGFALEGVKRVFWHQWPARFEQFVRQLRLGQWTPWHMPATATAADQVEVAQGRAGSCETDQDNGGFRVGVDAATLSQYEMLADAFREIGCQPSWISGGEGVGLLADGWDLACIDALSPTPRLNEKVSDMKERFPATPLVVLLNFPRQHDVEQLRQIGVSQVVSKPFQHVDLQWAVRQARLTLAES
ncbi:MAG: hypothetical protein MK108_13050 [Mariniblastus sp.]|nr:hypothetical protein [Mariniblastus sp.]